MEAFLLDVGGIEVEAGLDLSAGATALLVLGHGAGAGMRHAFMDALTAQLVAAGVGVLRYQFPYMQAGRRRIDPEPVLLAAVRAAIDAGARRAGGLPLFAGGKSMGGRMTSRALAAVPDPRLRGLVFVGFPLHPAGKPAVTRAAHLTAVPQPLLFLAGTRDALAELGLMRQVAAALPRAAMVVIEGADHGFGVLKRSGRTDPEVLRELAEQTAAFCAGHAR